MKDAAFFNEDFIEFNRDFVPEMLHAVAVKLQGLAPSAAVGVGAGAGVGQGVRASAIASNGGSGAAS